MFFKPPKHRRFQYQPKYVAPQREERLKFSGKIRYHRYGAGRNAWYFVLLALAFLLIYFYLSGGFSFNSKIDRITLSPNDAASAVDTSE